MYKVLKHGNMPDLIASSKRLIVGGRKTNWMEEEWYTKDISIPAWWNDECHRMVETQTAYGKGLQKYCLICDSTIPESGCKHNLIK